MPKIVVSDVPGFTGEYDLDLAERPFTGWDAHIIKKIAGVGLSQFDEAVDAGDYDLVIALTVITLVRAEKITKAQALKTSEVLMEADLGKITLVGDDVGPPAVEPSSRSSEGSSGPSGETTNGTGDPSGSIPVPTGSPG